MHELEGHNLQLTVPEPLMKSKSLLSSYLSVQSPDTSSCTFSPFDSHLSFSSPNFDSIFLVTNLTSGHQLDLRDECKATFPYKFTQLLSLPASNSTYMEML